MTEFVVGESVLVDGSLSEFETMKIFFDVADERGHLAPSVVVDDDGRVLTHRDYSDRSAAVHHGAGMWAFCRRPLPEVLGLPEGTSWVREVLLHLMLDDRLPYPMDPFFHYQPYIQRFDSAEPLMLPPVRSVATMSVAPDGRRICVLEETVGSVSHVLWEYELGLGTRRLVAAFPPGSEMISAECSYGPDGNWLLLCGNGRCRLVRVADGLTIMLPVRAEAAAWNPRNGPDALILMITDRETGSVSVHDYDLGTEATKQRSVLLPRGGQPLDVRELALAADERALVVAPVGATGFDQASRGGVWAVAQVDLDAGTITSMLPAAFKTPYASRRHAHPQWCSDPYPTTRLTSPSARLLDAGAVRRDEPSSSTDGWGPLATDIVRAWQAGAVPVGTLAQELIQYALSCGDQAREAIARLDVLGRGHPIPRAVRHRIDDKRRLWNPITADALPSQEPGRTVLSPAIARLIEATAPAEIRAAADELARDAPGEPWIWLATLGADALRTADYRTGALIALGTYRWNVHHLAADWSMRTHALGATPREHATTIYLNGFEACTHLPERVEIARVAGDLHDVESVRDACRRQLQHLPLADALAAGRRPRRPRGEPTTVIRPRFTSAVSAATGTAFIAYQREDLDLVRPIVTKLRLASIDTWMDLDNLPPGGEWQPETKRAIRTCGAFVAFFSPRYIGRRSTYMNEELREAVAQARLMHIDARWFIPVMLERCEIPDMAIDGTTDMANLHYIDFSADWDTAMTTLARTLTSILHSDERQPS